MLQPIVVVAVVVVWRLPVFAVVAVLQVVDVGVQLLLSVVYVPFHADVLLSVNSTLDAALDLARRICVPSAAFPLLLGPIRLAHFLMLLVHPFFVFSMHSVSLVPLQLVDYVNGCIASDNEFVALGRQME